MRRRWFARARLVLPSRAGFALTAAFFLVLEAPIRFFERLAGPPVDLFIRPAWPMLLVVAIGYGFYRAGFHPALWSSYGAWLESTPWTDRKPLPMGPVELVWEDGTVLAFLFLLASLLRVPRAPYLLCGFLMAHLLALAVIFWIARSRDFGYITMFALGFAVLALPRPIVCLSVLSGTYLVAYEGLRRGLKSFPWKERKPSLAPPEVLTVGTPDRAIGWPHGPLMRDAIEAKTMPWPDAALISALAGLWALALISLVQNPRLRLSASTLVLLNATCVAIFGRLADYVKNCRPPISLWGRLCTFRWIVPNYDRVFAAPLCVLLAAPAAVFLFRATGMPPWASRCAAIGVVAFVAMVTPPGPRNWRLTGAHRIVNTNHDRNLYTRAG